MGTRDFATRVIEFLPKWKSSNTNPPAKEITTKFPQKMVFWIEKTGSSPEFFDFGPGVPW